MRDPVDVLLMCNLTEMVFPAIDFDMTIVKFSWLLGGAGKVSSIDQPLFNCTTDMGLMEYIDLSSCW
jgi:hypothetical protein